MDEAIAWLLKTDANHDHVLSLTGGTNDFTTATKVPTNGAAWNTGFNFNATAGVQNEAPASGDILGQGVNLDIIGGGLIRMGGLDHYNNFGFV